MTFGKAVIINGGDTYVAEYRERYGAIDQIMTGVNQESVWSSIDFDSGTFREQTSETRDYFCKYLETCKADGVEVTTNARTIIWHQFCFLLFFKLLKVLLDTELGVS